MTPQHVIVSYDAVGLSLPERVRSVNDRDMSGVLSLTRIDDHPFLNGGASCICNFLTIAALFSLCIV